ncbi:Rieske (2Fe-2S) protein [Echinicola jeungdonensis]|uniref:Rieske (2Fe-2S) protein n=1 Tax=Echinicola jeungdonensis TaxID=709343 RepID=A0ABV5J224_9BACT|nr:Rieske (2Fe-2S) protein [Echinicola jeungdonensis]MDN3669036.1 Rieske (2Fe-2S) protein [Echinicola jeungdonensis]
MKKFVLGKTKEAVLGMLPENAIQMAKLGDNKICLVRIEEKVFAFEPFCPHRGAALRDGHINGNLELVCPLHHYRFALQSGQLASGGSCRDLDIFPTKLTDSGLEIFIGEE